MYGSRLKNNSSEWGRPTTLSFPRLFGRKEVGGGMGGENSWDTGDSQRRAARRRNYQLAAKQKKCKFKIEARKKKADLATVAKGGAKASSGIPDRG